MRHSNPRLRGEGLAEKVSSGFHVYIETDWCYETALLYSDPHIKWLHLLAADDNCSSDVVVECPHYVSELAGAPYAQYNFPQHLPVHRVESL